MSTVSSIIADDQLFNAAYGQFTEVFSEYTYESSKDAVSVFEDDVIIARIYFLKDLNEIVRVIKIIVYAKDKFEIFSKFFGKEIKTQLTIRLQDIYGKVDLALTTFECELMELSTEELEQSMRFVIRPQKAERFENQPG